MDIKITLQLHFHTQHGKIFSFTKVTIKNKLSNSYYTSASWDLV